MSEERVTGSGGRMVHRDADRVQAFIYGTIATLIAMAAFEIVDESDPLAAGAIIVASAIATCLAHAYSALLGDELSEGDSLTLRGIAKVLREAFPIVVAAIPATLLAIGAAAGYWTLEQAVGAANLLGIAIMAGAGLASARAVRATPAMTVVWVVGTAAIGASIVLVELAVHH